MNRSPEKWSRGARPCQAERHPAGEGVALVRQQRRIGRDHRDDGAGAWRRREVLGDRVVVRERLAHRHPRDREVATHAEVRLHEHPDDVLIVAVGERSRCRPRAALVRVAIHPGPTADRALLDRAGARGLERPYRDLDRDVAAVDVVQVAVPGLGHHREQPGLGDARVMLDGPGDDPGVRDPDRVRVGDHDRAGGGPRLLDPGDAGHLAVAVLRVEPSRVGVAGLGSPARVDRRHAGADALARDQRRETDLHAGDVGDRVPRSRLAGERDPQHSSARLARRRREMCVAHRPMLAGRRRSSKGYHRSNRSPRSSRKEPPWSASATTSAASTCPASRGGQGPCTTPPPASRPTRWTSPTPPS